MNKRISTWLRAGLGIATLVLVFLWAMQDGLPWYWSLLAANGALGFLDSVWSALHEVGWVPTK